MLPHLLAQPHELVCLDADLGIDSKLHDCDFVRLKVADLDVG